MKKISNKKFKGNVSMSMFLKKITLGAIIILAGLFALPGKVWAADEKVTIKVWDTKISFSGTGFTPKTNYYFIPSKNTTPGDKIICPSDESGNLSGDITTTPLTYFGTDRQLEITGKIYEETDAEVDTAIIDNVTAYLGIINVDPDITSDNTNGYVLTSDSSKKYETTFLTTKPNYIKEIKQSGATKAEPKSQRYTDAKLYVKDGDINVTKDTVSARLDPEPKLFTKSGYKGRLIVEPNIYVGSAEILATDFTNASSDFEMNLQDYSGTDDAIELIPDLSKKNSGTATGKIRLYLGDSLADKSPASSTVYDNISFDFTDTPPATTYKVVITEPSSQIIKTGTTSGNFSAKVMAVTSGTEVEAPKQKITWTVSSTDATLSKTMTTSSGETNTVTSSKAGKYTITAEAEDYSTTATPVKASFIIEFSDADYFVKGPQYLLVGDEFGDNDAISFPGDGEIYSITPAPPSGTIIKWKTSAPSTVNIGEDDGKIVMNKKASGLFKITATIGEGAGAITVDKQVTLVSIGYKTKAISVSTSKSSKIYLDMKKGSNTTISNDKTTITGFDADDPDVYIDNSQLYVLDQSSKGSMDVTTYLTFPDGSTGEYTDEMVYYPRVEITDTDTDECTIEAEIPNAAYSGYNDGNNIAEGAVVGYNVQLIYNNKAYASKSYFPKNFDPYYNTAEIDSDKLHEIIQLSSEDLAKDNVTGSKIDVSFRVSPCTKNKVNTKVGSISDEITAYRVSVSGDHITTNSVYGLEGHKVQLTATPNTGYELTGWSDSSSTTEKTRTFTVKTSGNAYTVTTKTSGSSNGSTSGNGTTPNKTGNSNLDKVPKTGESMAIYWVIMVAIISASIVAAVLYKYFTPKVRKWRGGDTDGNDNCSGRKS